MGLRSRICFAPLAVSLSVVALSATGRPQSPEPITLGFRESLNSEILGETRELRIYLPRGYPQIRRDRDQTPRYPVLYLLDGRPNFRHTAGLVHALGESEHIPRMIVVGIVNTDRWRDMTPTFIEGYSNTGGSQRFLRFMGDELVPHVESRYLADGYRVLIGHSLGGLVAVQAFVERPDIFDAIISLSPTLWWDDHLVLDDLQDFLEEPPPLNHHFYVAHGSESHERPDMLPSFARLKEILHDSSHDGLDWDADVLEREDHSSIRVQGTLNGLRSVFGDWALTPDRLARMSFEEIEANYARASKKYGTPRRVSQSQLFEKGFLAMTEGDHESAIATLEHTVKLFPTSPYSFDYLGLAYEAAGDKQRALDCFEKAYKLALPVGHVETHVFKEHLDRVKATR